MHPIRSARSQSRFLAIALALVVLGAALPSHAAPRSAERAAAPDSPIDVNKATEKELTVLPGVGPAMAKRIVAFRKEHGPFQRVEDLMKVKGIGEKSFQKLRPHVMVARRG